MNLSQLTQSRGFKNFMAKLYGIGASIVILGALFKITHIPYADEMLFVGLITEAVIFFFSAFEPPHVEPDWSIVYPELAGMYDHEDHDFIGVGEKESAKGSVTQQLDGLLSEAKIDGELIESLGTGLRNFSNSAGNMNKLTDTVEANSAFAENVKNASQSVSELTSSYNKVNEVIERDIETSEKYHSTVLEKNEAASSLSSAYSKAAEKMNNDIDVVQEFSQKIQHAAQSAGSLAEEYQKSVVAMQQSAEALNFKSVDARNYNDEMQKISSNLSALNAVYELQLQSTNEQVESSAKVQEAMKRFLGNLDQSIQTTSEYQQGVQTLAQNVEALNKVYGNMLSAMNVTPQS